jgi:hypothetical protein
MYLLSLAAFSFIVTSGSLATAAPLSNSQSSNPNGVDLVFPPTLDSTCCMYTTTEMAWQGERQYGCISPDQCRE